MTWVICGWVAAVGSAVGQAWLLYWSPGRSQPRWRTALAAPPPFLLTHKEENRRMLAAYCAEQVGACLKCCLSAISYQLAADLNLSHSVNSALDCWNIFKCFFFRFWNIIHCSVERCFAVETRVVSGPVWRAGVQGCTWEHEGCFATLFARRFIIQQTDEHCSCCRVVQSSPTWNSQSSADIYPNFHFVKKWFIMLFWRKISKISVFLLVKAFPFSSGINIYNILYRVLLSHFVKIPWKSPTWHVKPQLGLSVKFW